MKVNPKILSIPPYISTAWKNVISLHLEEDQDRSILIIGLVNGSTIKIPNLSKEVLESVFISHENYLEQETLNNKNPLSSIVLSNGSEEAAQMIHFPTRLNIEGGLENLFQHNSNASDTPDLPKDVLEKITLISKMIGSDHFPKPEPHCNCVHCQIMRVVHDETFETTSEEEIYEEESIDPEDLKFREWDIEPCGKQLYQVTNPFNTLESYNVFLGTPIGCTCGHLNCEHIRAVLNT